YRGGGVQRGQTAPVAEAHPQGEQDRGEQEQAEAEQGRGDEQPTGQRLVPVQPAAPPPARRRVGDGGGALGPHRRRSLCGHGQPPRMSSTADWVSDTTSATALTQAARPWMLSLSVSITGLKPGTNTDFLAYSTPATNAFSSCLSASHWSASDLREGMTGKSRVNCNCFSGEVRYVTKSTAACLFLLALATP